MSERRMGVRGVAWLACYLVLASATFAQVPLQFTYQGRLTDSNGVPVVGVVTGVFEIVRGGTATDTNGVVVHSETAVIEPDSSGVFSFAMGADTNVPIDLAAALDGAETRYLGMGIVSDQATNFLLPRQPILSVPYALTTPGSVPVGGLVPYYGDLSWLPPNWVACTGGVVAVARSPLNGFSVPDLREMFLRGVGDADWVGRTGGQDSTPSHSHFFSDSDSNVTFPRASLNGFLGGYNPVNEGGHTRDTTQISLPYATSGDPRDSHGHKGGSAFVSGTTGGAGFGDNRPRFVAVNYIMRIY